MLFDKNEGFVVNESHEPVVESHGAGIVDQDALLENMLIDQMNRMTDEEFSACLLYTSPSPRDRSLSRMPSSA